MQAYRLRERPNAEAETPAYNDNHDIVQPINMMLGGCGAYASAHQREDQQSRR